MNPLFTGESKCLPVNPCKNGGVCTEDLSGYKCSCKDGYNGINCEGKFALTCNSQTVSNSNKKILLSVFSIHKYYQRIEGGNGYGNRFDNENPICSFGNEDEDNNAVNKDNKEMRKMIRMVTVITIAMRITQMTMLN